MSVNWTVIALTLVCLFGFGVLYSLAVRHIARKGIEGQTAYLVVFGAGVTVIGSAAIIGWTSALFTLACFAASGLPMVVEYVIRISNEHRRDREGAAKIAKDLL